MSYRQMMKLAVFVAPASMGEWDRRDIEMLVDGCGAEVAIDFLEAYQRQFGVGLSRQIEWAENMRKEE